MQNVFKKYNVIITSLPLDAKPLKSDWQDDVDLSKYLNGITSTSSNLI